MVLQLLSIFLNVEDVVSKAERCCSLALAEEGSLAYWQAPSKQNTVGPTSA